MVWDIAESKIALLIELDGKSHENKNVGDRDDFVNELYAKVGIRLERVDVGSNFVDEISKIRLILNS